MLILKKNLIANLINKTKTNFNCDEATDLHSKKMPKAGSDYTCLVVINVDSALKKDETYYPQVFLKDRRFIERNY